MKRPCLSEHDADEDLGEDDDKLHEAGADNGTIMVDGFTVVPDLQRDQVEQSSVQYVGPCEYEEHRQQDPSVEHLIAVGPIHIHGSVL